MHLTATTTTTADSFSDPISGVTRVAITRSNTKYTSLSVHSAKPTSLQTQAILVF